MPEDIVRVTPGLDFRETRKVHAPVGLSPVVETVIAIVDVGAAGCVFTQDALDRVKGPQAFRPLENGVQRTGLQDEEPGLAMRVWSW